MRRLIYLEGIFSSPYFLTTQGIIFTGLALEFGLDEFHLSLASSFPITAQIFQLVAPLLVERIGSRKAVAVGFMAGSRIAWPILVLFLFTLHFKTPLAFLLAFAVTQVSLGLGNSVWISWMREMIPLEYRGKVLGTRNLFVSLSSMVSMYIFSLVIDAFKTRGYALVMGCVALTSTLAAVFILWMEDKPVKRVGFSAVMRKVLRDANFMRLAFFFFLWNVVIMSTSAFFGFHLLKNVGAPMAFIGFVSVLTGVFSMFFYWTYSRTADDVGHRTIAELGILTVSITAMMWLFMSEKTYRYLLIVDSLLTGMGWSAINLSFTTLPMEVASGSDPAYFSVYYAFGGLGGFLGSILGGLVGRNLSGVLIDFGDHVVYGLQVMFFVAGLMRLSMIAFLRKIEVRRYIPVRRLVYNTLALLARRVPLRPVEISIGVIRSRLRRLRRDERGGENESGEGGE